MPNPDAPRGPVLVTPHRHIHLGSGLTLDVAAEHGPDWFPLTVQASTRITTTVYLRRHQLRELRTRLAEIDYALPDPTDSLLGSAAQEAKTALENGWVEGTYDDLDAATGDGRR